MNSELENIFSQAQQLDGQSRTQLITHLTSQDQEKSKEDNPWLAIAGNLVDDPLFEDYLSAIYQYREDLDRKELEHEDDSAA